jgi:hypothetical protein
MARSRVVNLANFQTFTAINLLLDPGLIGGPVIIPNCVQVVLRWTLASGKIGHNVMYGRTAGVPAPTVPQADAILTALGTGAAWTAFAQRLSVSTALAGVNLRSVHTAGAPIFESTGAAHAGTNPAIALPNEVALCITERTAGTGRSNRGRIYIPGYANDAVGTGNVVGSAFVADTQTWANTIIAALSGQGMTLVVGNPARQAYTGSTGTPHPARPAGSVTVTALQVRDNHWDSQRRRGLD